MATNNGYVVRTAKGTWLMKPRVANMGDATTTMKAWAHVFETRAEAEDNCENTGDTVEDL